MASSPEPAASAAPAAGRWGPRVLALFLSLAAGVAVVEIGLRVAAHMRNLGLLEVAMAGDFAVPTEGRVALGHIIQLTENDRLIYELKPGMSGVEFKGAELSTNSYGFRGPEVPPATDDTVTIVAIGDSILFAHGAEEADGYASQLEDRLNRDYPGKSWRVINTGVPGYNTVMEVETLRTKALEFEPDLVLWNLVSNDLELPPYIRMEEDPLDPSRLFLKAALADALHEGPKFERHPLFGRSHEYTPEQQAARARGEELFEVGDGVPERYRDMVGWKAWDRAVDELVDLSREHGFKLLSFATVADDTIELMMEGARTRGVPTFHLRDELLAHMDAIGNRHYKYTDLVVSPDNLHPSRLQHAMACDKIVAELEALGWLEELAR